MTSIPTRQLERLDALLGEDRRAIEERESAAFDRAAYPHEGRIVIYGAGGLGRSTLCGLRANGTEPLAFADRNPRTWGSEIDGIPVYSPVDPSRQFGGDSVFVVAVWNPTLKGGMCEISAALRACRCERVVPFAWLFWKYSQTFLPYYMWDLPSRVLEQASTVREAFALFAGSRSRMEFLRHLELRLTGDFDRLGPPDDEAQYFPNRLFRPREDEYFVDCGAFDGDSLLSLADWTGGRFSRAVAFEADPANFVALERTVAADCRLAGRVRTIQAAVGRQRSKLRFAASGSGSAALSASGDTEVDCIPVDDVLANDQPTYIKMDIEGAEIDALQGAAVTLRSQPLVAACTYHTQDHLWQVPLQMRQLMPDSQMALRAYRADGFDLVCYAIPRERASIAAEEESVPAEELCHSSA